MKKRYVELKEAFDGLLAGTMTPEALKPVAAQLGIYQQRNGAFMVRVRVNGGEVACAKLAGIADLLDAAGGHAHLTSRQDIQLHDIPAERVVDAVLASDHLGLPFKGGGGNTYRNILVGTDSGLSAEAVFDVYPYAQALNRAMQTCEKAFALPRKLKIGVFASGRDRLRAAVQDLGFVAQRRDGQEGFTVFVAGGMGRESSVGLELFGFLPAFQVVRAAVALTELFYEHGDRANRQEDAAWDACRSDGWDELTVEPARRRRPRSLAPAQVRMPSVRARWNRDRAGPTLRTCASAPRKDR